MFWNLVELDVCFVSDKLQFLSFWNCISISKKKKIKNKIVVSVNLYSVKTPKLYLC